MAREASKESDGGCNRVPTKILFDNSLYRFCNLDDVVVRPTEVTFDGITSTIRLARVEPRTFDKWRQAEASALAEICDLARQGSVIFCISDDLRWELWNSYESVRTAHTGTELLRDIAFEEVPVPITRHIFTSSAWKASKLERTELCERLRQVGIAGRGAAWARSWAEVLSTFETESFIQLDRYAELCAGLSSTDDKLIDVFHLWTAERSNIPYFMTYDKTFVNFMTMTSKAPLSTVPIFPSCVLARLKLKP